MRGGEARTGEGKSSVKVINKKPCAEAVNESGWPREGERNRRIFRREVERT